MADELLEHPRIRALLEEADHARALLLEVGDDDENFKAALEQVYADLGRALHELLPEQSTHPDDEITAVGESPLVAFAEEAEEPTDPGVPPPEELRRKRRAQLLGRSHETGPGRRAAKRKRASERRLVAARTAGRRGETTPSSSMPAPGTGPRERQGSRGPAPWIGQLGDLLELLALPPELDDDPDLAAEASLVQWATVDLDQRWAPFPPGIKAALLGLVTARARHLVETLEVDAGPQRALHRLAAYQHRSGLNPVEGLHTDQAPRTDSWQGDARQWWDTLVERLRSA